MEYEHSFSCRLSLPSATVSLCDRRYAGVQCVTVIGYAKGVDFRVGHRFAAGKGAAAPLTHSWNAVYLPGAGGWQLVDVHWGARYMPCADKVVSDAYTGSPVAEDADKVPDSIPLY